MVDCLKSKFFILPALAVALLLYCGIFPVQKSSYSSLVALRNAAAFGGRVVSAPAKIQGRRPTYKVTLELSRVWDKKGLAAAASGRADFYLPAELCERHKPGSLYTAWRERDGGFLLDEGAVAVFSADGLAKIGRNKAGLNKAGRENNWREKNPAAPAFESREIISCRWPKGFLGRVQEFRALCRLHFSRLMFAWGSAGGLLLALLSGERSFLAKETADAFKLAGLSHILALSGTHLSLIGGLAFALGKKSLGKKFALALQFFSMLAFVWFAGKSPSLFRALLCSLCALVCGLFKVREKSPLNSLALVFLVHAALFPADAFELSFMLSYGALAGILAFNEFVSKPLCKAFPGGAGSSIGASAGAQIFTAPICLKFLGVVAPAGILSSAAVSPLVTIFVYAGLFFILLSLAFPPVAPFFGGLLGLLYEAIKWIAFFFARIPCVKI